MNDLYEKKEEFQDVNETNFNFGFGIENKKEFMLGGNDDFKLSIDDKDEDLDNIEDENIDDIDLEDIVTEDIDNLELEDIETDKIITEEVVEKPKKGKKSKK